MNKEQVKKELEAGKIQIENDAPDRLELFKELLPWSFGFTKYYKYKSGANKPFHNLPIIKLSEITEDVYQIFWNDKWNDVENPIRIKPQPDYTNEIEALQNKAKENGKKVVIVFEKL